MLIDHAAAELHHGLSYVMGHGDAVVLNDGRQGVFLIPVMSQSRVSKGYVILVDGQEITVDETAICGCQPTAENWERHRRGRNPRA